VCSSDLEVFYGNLMAFTLFVIHLEIEKFVVGEDTLCIEGNVHQMYPAAMLPVAFGIDVDDADDDEAVYMLTIRMALFFIFDKDGMGTNLVARSTDEAALNQAETALIVIAKGESRP